VKVGSKVAAVAGWEKKISGGLGRILREFGNVWAHNL
jgi:hypothetical protein